MSSNPYQSPLCEVCEDHGGVVLARELREVEVSVRGRAQMYLCEDHATAFDRRNAYLDLERSLEESTARHLAPVRELAH